MLEIVLSKVQLSAILSHAGESDSRPMLNGICFKVSAMGTVAAIASDGARVLLWELTTQVSSNALPRGDYVVRRDQLAQVLRFRIHPASGYTLRVYPLRCEVDAAGMATSGMALAEGRYPNVTTALTALLRDTGPNPYASTYRQEMYRPEYLIDQAKALFALAGVPGSVDVGRGAFCRQAGGVTSVVMPLQPLKPEEICRLSVPDIE